MALKTVRVTAPATSANLGPGFDCLGVALDIKNDVCVEKSSGLEVHIDGEGSETLPTNQENLVVHAAQLAYKRCGKPFEPLKFHCINNIPLASGLGSSSAAITCGLIAGTVLATNSATIHIPTILELACEIEGHPDNIGPCIYGGICICIMDKSVKQDHPADADTKNISTVTLPPFAKPLPLSVTPITYQTGLKFVLFVSDLKLETSKSRGVLPVSIPIYDAVYNITRTALLVNALASGNYEMLKEAMMDRLHQTYRLHLIPHFLELYNAGMEAGAQGVCVSGAGPSVLALVADDDTGICVSKVETAFKKVVEVHKLNGKVIQCAPSPVGYTVDRVLI